MKVRERDKKIFKKVRKKNIEKKTFSPSEN